MLVFKINDVKITVDNNEQHLIFIGYLLCTEKYARILSGTLHDFRSAIWFCQRMSAYFQYKVNNLFITCLCSNKLLNGSVLYSEPLPNVIF